MGRVFCSYGENLLPGAVTHTTAHTSSRATLVKFPRSPQDWCMTHYQDFWALLLACWLSSKARALQASATSFLPLVSWEDQLSPTTSDRQPTGQQAAIKQKWLPANTMTRGYYWTAQKSFHRWTPCNWGHEETENHRWLWRRAGGMGELWGPARQTPRVT